MAAYAVAFVRYYLSIHNNPLTQMSGKVVAFLISIRTDCVGQCDCHCCAARHSSGRGAPRSFCSPVFAVGGPDLVGAGLWPDFGTIFRRPIVHSVVFGRPADLLLRSPIGRPGFPDRLAFALGGRLLDCIVWLGFSRTVRPF